MRSGSECRVSGSAARRLGWQVRDEALSTFLHAAKEPTKGSHAKGPVLERTLVHEILGVLRVFPSIGALVTDVGGVLSHPAIIAREFGIPAVVGTGDATTTLRSGQRVTVDGTRGVVEAAT